MRPAALALSPTHDHILVPPHLSARGCCLSRLRPCPVQQREGKRHQHGPPSCTSTLRTHHGHTRTLAKSSPHLPPHHLCPSSLAAVSTLRPAGRPGPREQPSDPPAARQMPSAAWRDMRTADSLRSIIMHDVHACRSTGLTCGGRRSRARRWSMSASSATVASGSALLTSSSSGAHPFPSPPPSSPPHRYRETAPSLNYSKHRSCGCAVVPGLWATRVRVLRCGATTPAASWQRGWLQAGLRRVLPRVVPRLHLRGRHPAAHSVQRARVRPDRAAVGDAATRGAAQR